MKQKLLAVLPFTLAGYLLGSLLLVCCPPWVINQGPGAAGRLFEGYGWLWNRAPHQATNGLVDWPTLSVELVALLAAGALLLALYACWLRLRETPDYDHTPGHKNCPACDALRDRVTSLTRDSADLPGAIRRAKA